MKNCFFFYQEVIGRNVELEAVFMKSWRGLIGIIGMSLFLLSACGGKAEEHRKTAWDDAREAAAEAGKTVWNLASEKAGEFGEKVWDSAKEKAEEKGKELLESGNPQPDLATEEAIAARKQQYIDDIFLHSTNSSIGNWYHFRKSLSQGADTKKIYEYEIVNLAGRRENSGQYITNMDEERIWYLVDQGVLDINEARAGMDNLLTCQMRSLPMAAWYLEHGASANAAREYDGYTVVEQVLVAPAWEKNLSSKTGYPLLADQMELLLNAGGTVTDHTIDLALWTFFNPDGEELPEDAKSKYEDSYYTGKLEFSVFRQLWDQYQISGGRKKLPNDIQAAIDDDTPQLVKLWREEGLSGQILCCVANLGSSETVYALKEAGCDFGTEVLKAAIVGGNIENVKALAGVSSQADGTWSNQDFQANLEQLWSNTRMTVLDFALRYANLDMIRFLYEHTDYAVPIADFHLEYIETRADGSRWKLPWLDAGGRKKWVEWYTDDALYIAGTRRMEELVDFILEETEYPKDTARLNYAYGGRDDSGAAADGGAFLEHLLKRGLDPKAAPCNVSGSDEDDVSDMLAFQALRWKNQQDYELFVKYGFDITPYLNQCLHELVSDKSADHLETIQWLLDQGADPNAAEVLEYDSAEKGYVKKTYYPLNRAIISSRPDYVRLLQEYGAEYVQERGRTYEKTDIYSAYSNLDVKMDTEMLELILEMGADPQIRLTWQADAKEPEEEDPYNYNLFTWMMKEYLEIVRPEGLNQTLGLVVKSVSKDTKEWDDAHAWCYREFMKEVYGLLMEYGGDPLAEDSGGHQIQKMAAEAGDEEILKYLGYEN